MHYAVPIAFYRAGMLECLVTDITADARIVRVGRLLPRKFQPAVVRRLMGRAARELPPSKVRQFPWFGIGIGFLRNFAARLGAMDAAYSWIGRAFAKRVARSMSSRISVVYCFNGASLELLGAPASSAALKILEQTMAPRIVEDKLLREAFELYPAWTDPANASSGFHRPKLYRREADEWNAADVIVCGSQFVVDGVAEAGGPAGKCIVIPYGIDTGSFPGRARKLAAGVPIKVLVVGAVTLRKGAPLVLEAARKLGSAARIRMIGMIQIPVGAEQSLREHVELLGAVPRSEMADHFDWADVLLLPSYREGSATVTYEAMASGLPQIVTANSGAHVIDGRQGRVVAAGDVSGIVAAIRGYVEYPDTYAEASVAAMEAVRDLTLTRYQQRLVSLVTSKLEDPKSECDENT